MESKDFLNFFIGLCKGSRQLKPYSQQFSSILGYDDFVIDPSFRLSNNKETNPDMLIQSIKNEDTMVIEWTNGKNANNKTEQFGKYNQIDSDSLLKKAAVRKEALRTFDITIAINEEHRDQYYTELDDLGCLFPVLLFKCDDNKITVSLGKNTYKNCELNTFFNNGITFNHPPKYILFSPESNHNVEIINLVKSKILSILLKGIKKEFTTEELCEKICGSEFVWEAIGQRCKNEIIRKVRQIIKKIIKQRCVKDVIKQGLSPDIYEIDTDKFNASAKSVSRCIRKIGTSGIVNESKQLRLFDLDDDFIS